MKAIEFETTLGNDGQITVPAKFKDRLSGKKIKVTLRCDEEEESKSANDHYTKGYDQKDSLYDAY